MFPSIFLSYPYDIRVNILIFHSEYNLNSWFYELPSGWRAPSSTAKLATSSKRCSRVVRQYEIGRSNARCVREAEKRQPSTSNGGIPWKPIVWSVRPSVTCRIHSKSQWKTVAPHRKAPALYAAPKCLRLVKLHKPRLLNELARALCTGLFLSKYSLESVNIR